MTNTTDATDQGGPRLSRTQLAKQALAAAAVATPAAPPQAPVVAKPSAEPTAAKASSHRNIIDKARDAVRGGSYTPAPTPKLEPSAPVAGKANTVETAYPKIKFTDTELAAKKLELHRSELPDYSRTPTSPEDAVRLLRQLENIGRDIAAEQEKITTIQRQRKLDAENAKRVLEDTNRELVAKKAARIAALGEIGDVNSDMVTEFALSDSAPEDVSTPLTGLYTMTAEKIRQNFVEHDLPADYVAKLETKMDYVVSKIIPDVLTPGLLEAMQAEHDHHPRELAAIKGGNSGDMIREVKKVADAAFEPLGEFARQAVIAKYKAELEQKQVQLAAAQTEAQKGSAKAAGTTVTIANLEKKIAARQKQIEQEIEDMKQAAEDAVLEAVFDLFIEKNPLQQANIVTVNNIRGAAHAGKLNQIKATYDADIAQLEISQETQTAVARKMDETHQIAQTLEVPASPTANDIATYKFAANQTIATGLLTEIAETQAKLMKTDCEAFLQGWRIRQPDAPIPTYTLMGIKQGAQAEVVKLYEGMSALEENNKGELIVPSVTRDMIQTPAFQSYYKKIELKVA